MRSTVHGLWSVLTASTHKRAAVDGRPRHLSKPRPNRFAASREQERAISIVELEFGLVSERAVSFELNLRREFNASREGAARVIAETQVSKCEVTVASFPFP